MRFLFILSITFIICSGVSKAEEVSEVQAKEDLKTIVPKENKTKQDVEKIKAAMQKLANGWAKR